MSNLFTSLGSDLRDRRFLPILIVLCIALVAALAYAALGGGGGSANTSAPAASALGAGPAGHAGAIAIVKAPESSSSQAVAETTSGSAQHGSGAPRNLFKPLSSPKASSASTSASSGAGSGSSSGSSSSPSSSGSAGSAGSTGASTTTTTGSNPAPSKPSAPAKPRYHVHFHTTVQFGVVPPTPEGAPAQPAQSKTYSDIALGEPLPSKSEPELVYLGVNVKTGKDAAFALTGEAILKGSAVCRPSPSQCEAIELQAGQSETLEVVNAVGQTVTYELKVVSIEKTTGSASAARAHTAARRRKHSGK